MKYLLDTHLLLWSASEPQHLSSTARSLISNPQHELLFSAASLWEVAIKASLGRDDFCVDVHVLRRGLLDNEYHELAIQSEHAVMISQLPPLHKDPFDRILIAQAISEGVILLTVDQQIAQYSGPIQLV